MSARQLGRMVGMDRAHGYDVTITWTGNTGMGTSGYQDYARAHDVTADGPPPLMGSSDPVFRGDRDRWNPEQLFTAVLAQCHMLSYLHVCADSGVVVTGYTDQAHGTMVQTADGGGRFTEVVLRSRVVVASPDMVDAAVKLHELAHAKCFIASSVNFPVRHEPTVTVG